MCEETGKRIFYSKHAARAALVGQLKSKRIRVYPCEFHPGHFHVTKERSRR